MANDFWSCFFYFGALKVELTAKLIYQFTLSILLTTLIWLLGMYSLTFHGHFSFLFDSKESLSFMLDALFQLCFCLYAVVMLIGAVIDRVTTKEILMIVALWVIFVYCPLAYLIWNKSGLLSQLGVLDFSGGMVVHLSAGLSTYVLAFLRGKTHHVHNKIRYEWLFLGMILVTFGWFGFNAGPVGQLNQKASQVLINTLIAILSGGFSWGILSYQKYQKEDCTALLNGMVVGLVTSTAGVGFANGFQMLIITSVSSSLTYLLTIKLNQLAHIDDVVDSFSMNGLGGLFGSIGICLFYPKAFGVQLLAILLTICLSFIVTFMIGKVFFRKYKEKSDRLIAS